MSRTALVTGAASGFGLAVAKKLASEGNWSLHLLDINEENGKKVASSIGPSAKFYQADVTNYESLASAFEKAFKADGRLDFVHANAGLVERFDFFAKHPAESPPPEPRHLDININLKGVANTSYLALHYFRQSHASKDKSLVLTSSCCGIYMAGNSPLYTASKYGVTGLLRAFSGTMYDLDGVRVNAICPGPVRTNFADESVFNHFPQYQFTPVELIAKVVTSLADGKELVSADGKRIAGETARGHAVELSGEKIYFTGMRDYCDNTMRDITEGTVTSEIRSDFDLQK